MTKTSKLRKFLNEAQSDHSQLSRQDHELIHNLLENFGCRGTKENQDKLTQILQDFKDTKGGQHTHNYSREEFYEYARSHALFQKLEKKRT